MRICFPYIFITSPVQQPKSDTFTVSRYIRTYNAKSLLIARMAASEKMTGCYFDMLEDRHAFIAPWVRRLKMSQWDTKLGVLDNCRLNDSTSPSYVSFSKAHTFTTIHNIQQNLMITSGSDAFMLNKTCIWPPSCCFTDISMHPAPKLSAQEIKMDRRKWQWIFLYSERIISHFAWCHAKQRSIYLTSEWQHNLCAAVSSFTPHNRKIPLVSCQANNIN